MTKMMQTHEVGGHLASLSLVGKFHRRHRVYVVGHARTNVPVEFGKRLLERWLHKALHGARDARTWTAFLHFCSRRPVGGPAAVERGATSSPLPDEWSRRIGLTVTPSSFSLRRIISSLRATGLASAPPEVAQALFAAVGAARERIAGDKGRRLERARDETRASRKSSYERRAPSHAPVTPGDGNATGDRR
jgi:hypothetical protein